MSYAVIKNRNNTSGMLAQEFLIMLGASTNRGLTGQGVGTKMSGVQARLNGLGWYRASHDTSGPYLAWYDLEDYMIGDSQRKRVVVKIQRNGGEPEAFRTTVDANMFQSAWADNAIGRHYPIIREIILDAADEDADFSITETDSVELAPEGWTYTYIEIPEMDDECERAEECSSIMAVVRYPDYYFRKLDDVKWLSGTVGIGDLSSTNETRIYITAEGAPIAYVGYSSGDGTPEPAYDYILKETATTKWASMPKRMLEDIGGASDAIANAIVNFPNPDVVERILRSVIAGGWESTLNWWRTWRNSAIVRIAMTRITGGAPIVSKNAGSPIILRAQLDGMRFFELPVPLYDIGRKLGLETIEAALGIRAEGETITRKMTLLEAKIFSIARDAIAKRMPWVSTSGHVYRAIESDYYGIHHHARGEDVIGINFAKLAPRTGYTLEQSDGDSAKMHAIAKEVCATILHELTHHQRAENAVEDHVHGTAFIRDFAELVSPPVM